MELIRDNVKVEWEAVGEGLHGDYNPNNTEDIELLRFNVSVFRDGEWEEKEDASYCTNFPAAASEEDKMAALEILLDRFYDALTDDIDVSVKKLIIFCDRFIPPHMFLNQILKILIAFGIITKTAAVLAGAF